MGLGKDFTEIGLSLLTGAGLGVGLMYLFDPEQGNQRRDRITKSAADLLGESRETATERLSGFAEAAKRVVGSAVPDLGKAAGWIQSGRQSVSGLASDAREYAANAADQASHQAARARDAGQEWRQLAYDRAAEALHFGNGSAKRSESSAVSGTAIAAVEIVAAAAIGAGVMYLLDPERGARRRETLVGQLTGIFNGSSKSTERAVRHYANVARGTVAQAQRHFRAEELADDETVVARVRSAIGRCTTKVKSVNVEANSGKVTLSGTLAGDEAEAVVVCVRGVEGVREVENNLTVGAA